LGTVIHDHHLHEGVLKVKTCLKGAVLHLAEEGHNAGMSRGNGSKHGGDHEQKAKKAEQLTAGDNPSPFFVDSKYDKQYDNGHESKDNPIHNRIPFLDTHRVGEFGLLAL
jgi:hypothetical protein